MITAIASHLRQKLNYGNNTEFILNNTTFEFNPANYKPILPTQETPTLTFIDGGQAEILRCASFW